MHHQQKELSAAQIELAQLNATLHSKETVLYEMCSLQGAKVMIFRVYVSDKKLFFWLTWQNVKARIFSHGPLSLT